MEDKIWLGRLGCTRATQRHNYYMFTDAAFTESTTINGLMFQSPGTYRAENVIRLNMIRRGLSWCSLLRGNGGSVLYIIRRWTTDDGRWTTDDGWRTMTMDVKRFVSSQQAKVKRKYNDKWLDYLSFPKPAIYIYFAWWSNYSYTVDHAICPGQIILRHECWRAIRLR